MTNCLIWNNTATNGPQIGVESSFLSISCSNVQDGITGIYNVDSTLVWGAGNNDTNPLFCDAEFDDLFLHENSPCTEEKNVSCGLIGALPIGCGPTLSLVKPDGTGDYPTIFQAVDAAFEGGIVELADGTFTGALNKNINLVGPITIRSQSGDPRDSIIDCEGAGRGFTISGDAGSDTIVAGLTIINGQATNGGGISCYDTDPVITNCIVKNNSTDT
ncbi:MAG: hypothetical protein GY869_08290, partial [Planctomycetes bacterium]|nr:hypothetical protein [Planctomycetota bacterium]